MTEFKSYYKTASGNEGRRCYYPTRLDTYGRGCQHNCAYCYAKSLLIFRKNWNNKTPAAANMKEIEKTIVETIPTGSTVRLGGMTDCFQPVEKEVQNTYNTIKLLNKYNINYLIVTKSDLVATNKYLKVLDDKKAHIQISITSTNDKLAEKYEQAAATSKRIKAIEKLQELGFDISVRLSPYIENFVEFDKLNNIKCDKILIEFFRGNGIIKKNVSY